MSVYGSIKIPKGEAPEKNPFSLYLPHSIPVQNRIDNREYKQYVSIDPARKNFAMRIERRYDNGNIIPIVFDKVSIESFREDGDLVINDSYKNLNTFLDKYLEFYDDCHYIIIERQLPQNYKAVKISMYAISYFSIKLFNKPLLPAIIELDPKAKGKYLNCPKGVTDKQLKTWSVQKAHELLTIRKDEFSLGVMNYYSKKQDDLADCVCQIEALCVCWGYKLTEEKSIISPTKTLTLNTNNTNDENQTKTLTLNIVPIKTNVSNVKIPKILTVDTEEPEQKEPKFTKEYILNLSKVVDVKNIIIVKKLDIKNGGSIAISKINLSNLDEHKKIIIQKLNLQ